jgi:hypothetical protein
MADDNTNQLTSALSRIGRAITLASKENSKQLEAIYRLIKAGQEKQNIDRILLAALTTTACDSSRYHSSTNERLMVDAASVLGLAERQIGLSEKSASRPNRPDHGPEPTSSIPHYTDSW